MKVFQSCCFTSAVENLNISEYEFPYAPAFVQMKIALFSNEKLECDDDNPITLYFSFCVSGGKKVRAFSRLFWWFLPCVNCASKLRLSKLYCCAFHISLFVCGDSAFHK